MQLGMSALPVAVSTGQRMVTCCGHGSRRDVLRQRLCCGVTVGRIGEQRKKCCQDWRVIRHPQRHQFPYQFRRLLLHRHHRNPPTSPRQNLASAKPGSAILASERSVASEQSGATPVLSGRSDIGTARRQKNGKRILLIGALAAIAIGADRSVGVPDHSEWMMRFCSSHS